MKYGFMSRTHALLTLVLVQLFLLIPGPFNSFLREGAGTEKNITTLIIIFVVTVGGALLPDLDNDVSKAGYTLGLVGTGVTAAMKMTSSMMFSLYHLKGDRQPNTQHRYLWHTGIVALILMAIFWFGLDENAEPIMEKVLKEGLSIIEPLQLTAALFVTAAVLVGISALKTLLNKLTFAIIGQMLTPLTVLIGAAMTYYTFNCDGRQLKYAAFFACFGYLCHIIEDCFADSGAPLLWPIPINGRAWYRVHTPITANTQNGAQGFIIDIIAGVVAALLVTIT